MNRDEPSAELAKNTLNAIVKLLAENVPKPPQSNASIDSDLSIDPSTKLLSQLNAIVKNYREQIGEIPFSGVDGLELDLESESNSGQLIAQPNDDDERPDEVDQQLRDSTHPFVYNGNHVEISTFIQNMMDAGRRSRPRKLKYKNVEVMIMTWQEEEDADAKNKKVNALIEGEVEAVAHLFEEKLNYHVSRYTIPYLQGRTKAQQELQLAITSFVRQYDDPNTLLIFYYNGHGSYYKDAVFFHPTAEASLLHSGFNPTGEFRGPSLKWNPVQESIETEADVLIMLDCCYAGGALVNKGPSSTKEILTACGKGAKTPAGKNSFSMRLVEATEKLLGSKKRFLITELYADLLNSDHTAEPMHVIRGDHPITIEPQPRKSSSTLKLPSRELTSGSSASSSFSELDDTFSQNDEVTATDVSSTISTGSSFLVTVAIRLYDNIVPKFANWSDFIASLPAEEVVHLEKVTVEAAFPSNSTLLVVSMPVSIWLLLPQNMAYSFLGFVKSNNMLLPKELAVTRVDKRVLPVGTIDSDSNLDSNSLVAAVQAFNKFKAQEMKHKRPGAFVHTVQKLATKLEIPSRLESDENYALVSQLAQRFEIEKDKQGEFTIRYDLHFIEKIFEEGKKSVKDVIHNASGANDELELTITTKIDQLEKEVLGKLDSRSNSNLVKTVSTGMKDRASSTHGMNPEEELGKGVHPAKTDIHRSSRGDSIKSTTLKFRSDSLKSKSARIDSGSNSKLARLGRKL